MRIAALLMATVLLIVMFSACSPGTGDAGPTMAGGVSAPADNINLKDIDIVTKNGQTVITISLLSGSRIAGYAESKLTLLPAYEVGMLSQPHRLRVRLDDISFWDYEQKTSWDVTGLVAGLFREVPANDNSLIIYVQLTQDAEFSVEESEGSLVISLTPGIMSSDVSYYCVSNAFYEYQEGTWPSNIDMAPVLCSDKQNRLLISKPFSTLYAAEDFLKSSSEVLKQSLPDKTLSVIQLPAGTLPDYATDIDYSIAEGRSVLLKEGRLINTPVIIQNGRYLSTAPDGRTAFSRPYQPGEPALEQDNYLLSEKLWVLETNGRIQNVDVPEFFYIDRAAFSADGRYIALLDVSIENRVLYVYDFFAGALINLGEEGFGSQTSAFAWSDQANTLYVMSGYDSLQLQACTFDEDGLFEISAVEEQPGSEGSIAVYHDRIFFADSIAQQVYEIGETRRFITTGANIKISPDGKTLVVLEMQDTENEQVLTRLKLCNTETGDTQVIQQNAEIIDFCFLNNGMVVYTDASASSPADGYPYGLYAYDAIGGGPPVLIGYCSTPKIETTQGKVLLIDYIGNGGKGFYATYIYDPNAKV